MEDVNVEVLPANPELTTRALVAMEQAEEKNVKTPVQILEEGLVEYAGNALQLSTDMEAFKRGMQQTLLAEYGDMSHDEQIALYNIECQQSNDRLFKLLSPTFGVVNNRQTAEIQAQAAKERLIQQGAIPAGGVNVQINNGVGTRRDDEVAESMDPKTKNALDTWYRFTQAAEALMAEKKAKEQQNAEEAAKKD